MSKSYHLKFAGILLMLFNSQVFAARVTFTPLNIVNPTHCTSNVKVKKTVANCSGTHKSKLVLNYKSKRFGAESGKYKRSYSTTFSNSSARPEDALISFDNGALGTMDCVTTHSCYLSIKGGKQTRSVYVFHLGLWDGKKNIKLSGFWPRKGYIKNIQLWSAEPISNIPLPATAWLFVSGLVGLIGMTQKIRRSA